MMHIGGLACNLSCIVMPTATRVGHFPNRPFLSIIAFADARLLCRFNKIMLTSYNGIRLSFCRAFDSPHGYARPSPGQGPISL